MTSHPTTPTCTVRFATTGACGKPAVYSFTGSNGETFGECAEHYDPRFHKTPDAPKPVSRNRTFNVRGHSVRSASPQRYFVVFVNHATGTAKIVKRSNSFDAASAAQRRHGGSYDKPTVIIDTHTGQEVG